MVLGSVFLFLGDENEKVSSGNKRATKEITENLSATVRQQLNEEEKELKGKLNVIIQRGLRERREGNYFRAIAEFSDWAFRHSQSWWSLCAIRSSLSTRAIILYAPRCGSIAAVDSRKITQSLSQAINTSRLFG